MRATVDDVGEVLSYDDYDPWGLILNGRSMTAQANLPNKFTGKEWDDDFGLNWNYFGARYYDPVIGRFPTIDPLLDQFPGVSPYSYPFNNPLRFSDPTGMMGQDQNDKEKNEQIRLVGEVQRVQNELDKIKAEQPSIGEVTVRAFAETADALSDASTVGAAAGVVVTVAGVAIGNPPLVAAGIEITSASLAAGTTADITSTLAKTTDAIVFDGSVDAALEQGAKTLFNVGTGRVSKSVAGRVVTRTTSSVSGPLFRSPQTGRFVTNNLGITVTTAADATTVVVTNKLSPFKEQ